MTLYLPDTFTPLIATAISRPDLDAKMNAAMQAYQINPDNSEAKKSIFFP